jgi:hypothetical protein
MARLGQDSVGGMAPVSCIEICGCVILKIAYCYVMEYMHREKFVDESQENSVQTNPWN